MCRVGKGIGEEVRVVRWWLVVVAHLSIDFFVSLQEVGNIVGRSLVCALIRSPLRFFVLLVSLFFPRVFLVPQPWYRHRTTRRIVASECFAGKRPGRFRQASLGLS